MVVARTLGDAAGGRDVIHAKRAASLAKQNEGGGFNDLGLALRSGSITGAKIVSTGTLIFNARLDAVVCGVFMLLVAVILIDSVRIWVGILRGTREARVVESPFVMSHLSPEEI